MRPKNFDELIHASAIERYLALKELGYEGAELLHITDQLIMAKIKLDKEVSTKSADAAREILNKTIF